MASAFDGKVAVVTGGASGIGKAVAERLAADGASVVVSDLDGEAGRQVAEAVGGRFVQIDVSDAAQWGALVDAVTDEFGGIDLAHLNAGVTTGSSDLVSLTEAQYRRIMGANVDGVVYGARAVIPAMAGRDHGAIVVTASLAGLIPFDPDPIYTATKHAVVGLVRSLAAQLRTSRITINAVCPGLVDTPLVGAARELLAQAGFPLIPPSDIAAAVVEAMTSGQTGECYVCQPGRGPERYHFGSVPGPRTEGAVGVRPPGLERT